MIIMSAIATAKQQASMLDVINKRAGVLYKTQIKAKEATDKLTKSTKELVKEEGKIEDAFERRTQSQRKAIKAMNEMGKQFELLNYHSLKEFKKAGGNTFEYLDMVLSGTSEQIKLMGIEVGTARRVLYGFFPPGMFRLVSKLSTGFKFFGSIVRAFTTTMDEDGKKIENLFTRTGKGIKFLAGKRKKATSEDLNISKKLLKLKGKFVDLDLKANLKAEDEKLKKKLKGGNYFINLAKQGQKAQQKIILESEQNIANAKKAIQLKAHNQVEKMMPTMDRFDKPFQEMVQKIEKDLLNLSAANPLSDINVAMGKKATAKGKEQEQAKALAMELDKKAKLDKKSKADTKRAKKILKLNADTKKILKRGEKWQKRGEKARNLWTSSLKPLLSGLGSFILSFMLFAALVISGLVILQALWPSMKAAFEPAFAVIMDGFTLLWEGVQVFFGGIFDLFDAIMNGGFIDIMLALWEIVKGFGMIVWGLIKVLLGGLVVFLYEMALGLWDKAKNWVTSLGNDLKSVGKIAGLIFAIAGMMIAWMYGAPILLIVGIGILLYKFGKWVVGAIGFANGGTVNTNMQIVGEKGPELVSLPKGSRVHSNKDSKSMASGSGGVTNNFNITINAKDTSDGELRRIAEKVGQMVNSKINRSTSASTMR